MSVDTSSPSTSAAKQKTTRHYVKKPNQEEKDAQIKEIEANIEKLRPQLVGHPTLHAHVEHPTHTTRPETGKDRNTRLGLLTLFFLLPTIM